ncbi:hypothetical protein [Propionivibrio limicola]|uniref:hypothetical protein n=1 Tax=Propionivibrio limicola TaxID=167645 RepID=UPI00129289F4|nr:hypothetical protein [Propionivibrio limicola]
MNAEIALPFAKGYELDKAVALLCAKVPVSTGASGLARELSSILSDFNFRDVLTRGGWYRLGGVVDAAGAHIADDLALWAEAELAAHGDDIHALVDAYLESGFKATRYLGKTHYLVAATGSQAADFIQIEIEELQEVVSHELFSGDEPGSLEELYEPPSGDSGKSLTIPVGTPFYSLRRIVDVSDFLRRMAAQKPEPQIVHRFFDAWQASSAGNTTQFSNHWVVAVREYLDRFQQTILQATPVCAMNGFPPKFEIVYGAKGLALYQVIQKFDRQIGYPMAWFFHMLTTKTVPHAVASAVIDDVQSGFSYLPERDVKVVKDWLHRPYSF